MPDFIWKVTALGVSELLDRDDIILNDSNNLKSGSEVDQTVGLARLVYRTWIESIESW